MFLLAVDCKSWFLCRQVSVHSLIIYATFGNYRFTYSQLSGIGSLFDDRSRSIAVYLLAVICNSRLLVGNYR